MPEGFKESAMDNQLIQTDISILSSEISYNLSFILLIFLIKNNQKRIKVKNKV